MGSGAAVAFVVLGFACLIMGVVVVAGCCSRHSFLLAPRVGEYHAPLIDEAGYRLDAAIRDAEEGFSRCSACGFENFKRTVFCSLCGARVPAALPTESATNGTHEAGTGAKWFRTMFGLEDKSRGTAIENPAGGDDESIGVKLASRRQLRAQRRKEWTRRLDLEGRPFWHRDPSSNFTNMAASAFVVTLHSERAFPLEVQVIVDPNETVEAATHVDSQHDEDMTEAQPTPETLHAQQARLEKLAHITKLSYLDPAEANPSALPINIAGVHELDAVHTREIVHVAAKDFPAKYAHFVTVTSSLIAPAAKKRICLRLDRSNLFDESLQALAIVPTHQLRSILRIDFLGEHGVDAGGVHREWFIMLTEMLADPQRGLFVCVDKSEQTYHLNPNSARDAGEKHLLYLYAVGRIIGRALLEGSVMGMHLCPALLKLMLGLPLSFSDMEDFDPEMYRSMQWLLENDDVDALGLDFTVTVEAGDGTHQVVELVPNGSAVAVTDVNKQSFVDLKWKFLLVERVSGQLQALLRGFYEVVPADLLMLLDASELDFLLCGSDEIDVDDWEKHTNCSTNLHDHFSRQWFWEIVREMPNEYRRRLLLFSTGSSRVPLAGFAALTSYDGKLCPFTLKGMQLVGDGFIHSHACFNRLDLPLHVVRSELRAVMYAALETEQYGFTTD